MYVHLARLWSEPNMGWIKQIADLVGEGSPYEGYLPVIQGDNASPHTGAGFGDWLEVVTFPLAPPPARHSYTHTHIKVYTIPSA